MSSLTNWSFIYFCIHFNAVLIDQLLRLVFSYAFQQFVGLHTHSNTVYAKAIGRNGIRTIYLRALCRPRYQNRDPENTKHLCNI